ncbi:hypothetical protein [Bradyrhizobium sp. WSM1743]|uniref:hypothetical protein n=1 Tax=Bradyrhizobium sp. WSM1743 TaxID=318996 RepID=UPI0012EB3E84
MARTDLPRVRNALIDQVVSGYLDMRPVRPLERRAINALGAAIADGLAMKLITAEKPVGTSEERYCWRRRGQHHVRNDVAIGRARHLEHLRFRRTDHPGGEWLTGCRRGEPAGSPASIAPVIGIRTPAPTRFRSRPRGSARLNQAPPLTRESATIIAGRKPF